jgi:hypothetical protein
MRILQHSYRSHDIRRRQEMKPWQQLGNSWHIPGYIPGYTGYSKISTGRVYTRVYTRIPRVYWYPCRTLVKQNIITPFSLSTKNSGPVGDQPTEYIRTWALSRWDSSAPETFRMRHGPGALQYHRFSQFGWSPEAANAAVNLLDKT